MKEITRIVDAKITVIVTVSDNDADKIIEAKKDAAEKVANDLKNSYHADDVQVEIHDFVMDKGE